MNAVDRLLQKMQKLHLSTPALQAYAPWPTDLTPLSQKPKPCPVARKIKHLPARKNRATSKIFPALQEAAPHLRWKQTYTEAEVGQNFLQNYGYIELFGPDGHFHSQQARGYIGIWGADLTYDWHNHEAEELYFALAGEAVFCADGSSNKVLRPGDDRIHSSNQRHMMVTLDKAFIAYALWKGDGMDGLPRMVSA